MMKVNKCLWAVGLSIAVLVGCEEKTYINLEAISAPLGAMEPAKAIGIALKDAGFENVSDVNLKKCEVEGVLLKAVYEIEFTKNFFEYEYDIDAASGRIIKSKRKFGW